MEIAGFLRSIDGADTPTTLELIGNLAELGNNQWQLTYRVPVGANQKTLVRVVIEAMPSPNKLQFLAKFYRYTGTAPNYVSDTVPALNQAQNFLFPETAILGEYQIDQFLTQAGIPREQIQAVTSRPNLVNFSRSQLGANLDSVTYYNAVPAFRNLWKQSQNWQVPGQSFGNPNNLTLDAKGDITNFNGNVSAQSLFFGSNSVVGTYILKWDGYANAVQDNYISAVSCTIQNATANQCEIVVGLPQENAGITVRPVPNMGTDYLRNFRLYRQSDSTSPDTDYEEQPFNPEFLNYASMYSYIRFMDWFKTNNSPLVNWSDRRPADYSRQVCDSADGLNEKGVAYEYAIKLCNTLSKDMWVCVPHQATDDFVTQMATLIKEQLGSGLNVYVEWSNEVWNGQFSQASYAQNTTTIPADGLGYKYYAKRASEVWAIFETVFGSEAGRLRKVFASQVANSFVATEGLDWLIANGGIPDDLVFSGAPYINGTYAMPGGGKTQGGIPAGNVGQYDSGTTSWTDLGPYNAVSNTGPTTFNAVIPGSPSDGQKWYNNSNIQGLSTVPDWAIHYNEKSVWENQVLALNTTQMLAALQDDVDNYRRNQIEAFVTAILGKSPVNPTFINYEQNQHLYSDVFSGANEPTAYAAFEAVMNDPQFIVIFKSYLDMILEETGTGGTQFAMTGHWSKFGYWGAVRRGNTYAGTKTNTYTALAEWNLANQL